MPTCQNKILSMLLTFGLGGVANGNMTYIRKNGSQQIMKVQTMTAIVRAAFRSLAIASFALSFIIFCISVSSFFAPSESINVNRFIETALTIGLSLIESIASLPAFCFLCVFSLSGHEFIFCSLKASPSFNKWSFSSKVLGVLPRSSSTTVFLSCCSDMTTSGVLF